MRRLAPIALALALAAACSDKGGDGATTTTTAAGGGSGSTSTTEAVGDVDLASPYCVASAAFKASTGGIPTGNAALIIAVLKRSAEALHKMADAAPDRVKDAHQRAADAADEYVSLVEAKNPVTLQDYIAARDAVRQAVIDKYRSEEALGVVRETARVRCNVTLSET